MTCPASRGGAAGLYGSNEAGWYCCPTPHNGGHCAEAACKKESDKNCACCTDPGSKEGCQGAPRCTASPIKRKNGTIPCNQGPTGPAKITLQDMKDIKAALQGKIVDPVTGVVDHSSTALTPHLKLGTSHISHLTPLCASDVRRLRAKISSPTNKSGPSIPLRVPTFYTLCLV